MSFSVKDWINELSPLGPPADPSVGNNTPISAQALEDLEQRLSDYTASAPLALQEVYGAVGSDTVTGVSDATSAIQDAIDTDGVAVGGDFWYGVNPGVGIDLTNARYVDLKLVRRGTYAYGDNDSRIVTNSSPMSDLTGRITIDGRLSSVQRADDTTGNTSSGSATISSVADTSTYLAAVGMWACVRKASDGSKVTWDRTGVGGSATEEAAIILSKTGSTLVMDGTANASSTGASVSFDQSKNLRSTSCQLSGASNLSLVLAIYNYPGGGFHISGTAAEPSDNMVVSLTTRSVQRGACVPKGDCSGSLYLDLVGPDGADDLVNLASSPTDVVHDFALYGRALQGAWQPGGGNECLKVTGATNVGIWMELSGGAEASLLVQDRDLDDPDTGVFAPTNVHGHVVISDSGRGVDDPNVQGHGIVVRSQMGSAVNLTYKIRNPGGCGVVVVPTGGGTVEANLEGGIFGAGQVDATATGVRYRDPDGGGEVFGSLRGDIVSPVNGGVGMIGSPGGKLHFDVSIHEPDPTNAGGVDAVEIDGPDVGIQGLRVRRTTNDYRYALNVTSGNVYVENIDALIADCTALTNGTITTPKKALPVKFDPASGDNLISPSEASGTATVPQIIDLRRGTASAPDTGDETAVTAQPLVKLQRVKANTRTGSGGTLARLTPVLHLVQKSLAADQMVNCTLVVEADSFSTQTTHASSGDAQAIKCYARTDSGSSADVICFVAVARQNSNNGTTVLELHADKDGTATAYNPTSAGPDAGIRLTAGINDISVGVLLRKSGSDTGLFHNGYVVNAEDPVANAAFRDDGDGAVGLWIGQSKSNEWSFSGEGVTAPGAIKTHQEDLDSFGVLGATDFPVLGNTNGDDDVGFAIFGDGTFNFNRSAETPPELQLTPDVANGQLILTSGSDRLLIAVP